jgi:hypothetical protein
MLIEGFRGFPQSLQANAGIILRIKPRSLPTISFTIHHYSLIILYSLVTEKNVNKLPTNLTSGSLTSNNSFTIDPF